MRLRVFDDRDSLGKAAASQAASAIRRAIAEQGRARIVGASAASQFEFLDALTATPDIDWEKVDAALGRKGAVSADVHRYGFPRSDLTVKLVKLARGLRAALEKMAIAKD